METRTILQIVLVIIGVAIVALTALIIKEMTREAETVIVEQIIETDTEVVERRNPWADQGDAAILLVKRTVLSSHMVPPPPPPRRGRAPEVEPESATLELALQDEDFVKNRLKQTGEPMGWEVTWWEETKFGPHFYLVRYTFQDGNLRVGPEWLVDLRSQKVVPKNVTALVAQDPAEGVKSDYYDKDSQIVSAIANHRFSNGMSLAGALLLYFETREDGVEEDTILGWTVVNDRGGLFKAYFQWTESQAPSWAEFEFDYDQKALKAVNLQAANIMRVGEDFDRDRVSIMPASYDPSGPRGINRWQGDTRQRCRQPANAASCRALASVLDETEVVESLEWLLTARAATAEDFERCKTERACSWRPEVLEPNVFRIHYNFNLDGDEESVAWDVRGSDITPVDRVSQLAFSVIRPRN